MKTYIKLNPEIKKLWLNALRSGEYKQARRKLRVVDDNGETEGFCCLGVLCNLHAQAYPEIAKGETDPARYLGEIATPPMAVWRWAMSGRKCTPLSHDYDKLFDLTDYLMVMNDIDEASFTKIANWIDKNL